MKVYMFYLVGINKNMNKFPAINYDEIIQENNLSIYPYAWTADKLFRKQFKNVRDMNKFYEQILDIDDFESFANINSETMLEFRRVNTKVVKNKKIHSESIKILSTGREINYATMNINDILSSIISENLYNDYTEFIRPNLYSKEFMKTLKKLDIENVISDVKNMDKLPWSLHNMDSLNIYITAFANTYKK